MNDILPFNYYDKCPKCAKCATLKDYYVMLASRPIIEFLVCKCICGYSWLEHTADYKDTQELNKLKNFVIGK